MDAAVEVHRRPSHVRRMQTIVVDDELAVDEQRRTVIRQKRKAIDSWLLNPKTPGVVDREPLIAMYDAREAVAPVAGRDVEFRGPDGADALSRIKSRKYSRPRANLIDFAAQPGRNNHGSPEDRLLGCLTPQREHGCPNETRAAKYAFVCQHWSLTVLGFTPFN